MKSVEALEGSRILILAGSYEGEEGVCLGKVVGSNRWAVSPNSSNEIFELQFERDFALLLDFSVNASSN